MITDEDKERVRQATDFLQLVSETVELRRRGADWWGCCPFHHEKSPSFHINPSTGLWKCFGCGLGGDVFDYVMKRENLGAERRTVFRLLNPMRFHTTYDDPALYAGKE